MSDNDLNKLEHQKKQFSRDVMLGGELWTSGLICAFEFVRCRGKTFGSRSSSRYYPAHAGAADAPNNRASKYVPTSILLQDKNSPTGSLVESAAIDSDTPDGQTYHQDFHSGHFHTQERSLGNYWIPIGWTRIFELLQTVQVDAGWMSHPIEFTDDEEDVTVAEVAAPYWERPVGPTWWCHVAAGHPFINSWLSNAQWLHPAISIALRDESKLISERMKHLLYEVPVRVAGGLLFELLGQSVGDPFVEEDDIPIVLRS